MNKNNHEEEQNCLLKLFAANKQFTIQRNSILRSNFSQRLNKPTWSIKFVSISAVKIISIPYCPGGRKERERERGEKREKGEKKEKGNKRGDISFSLRKD